VEKIKTPCLLQPLGVPNTKWESTSMDIILKLPKNQICHDNNLVIMDRLIKQAHFMTIKSTVMTMEVVKLCLQEIFGLQDLPKENICDKDHKCLSQF
jgi:hypothetical protein